MVEEFATNLQEFKTLGKLEKNMVSCRCFVMFPTVGKLGNILHIQTLSCTKLKVLFMFALFVFKLKILFSNRESHVFVLQAFGNTCMGKLGNIISPTKMFLNLLGNIFAS